MAWRQTGDKKPLHEPLMTQFTDTLLNNQATMG